MTPALLAALCSLAAAQAEPGGGLRSEAPAAQPATPAQPAPRSAEGPAHEELGEQASEPPTLESWIPPVSGRAYGVADRFELQPGLGLSFDDPFLEKFVPQISAGYHIGEEWYAGLKIGYAISTSAGNVGACNSSGSSCGSPTSTQLQSLPGAMTLIAFAEGGWTPFYGKVNLFGETVFHFDFSLLLGVGGILAWTPASPDGTVPGSNAFQFALGPGIGEHFFVSERMAIAAELRDYIYSGSGGIQNQPMFNLGFSFLLGGSAPQG